MRISHSTTVIAALVAALAIPATATARSTAPLAGRAMWIWYVSRSAGGDLGAIAREARAAGVRTLIVKSGDGSNYWSQFNPELVRRLHREGLHVCAWQYVYGTRPVSEAAIGARAAREGAECLVIDAETEYEGRYGPAQAYLQALRRSVGRGYVLGLASFPYVDYHPAFPYSVFLGPGGAQLDVPQMYWRDIGTTPASVFRHTYTWNRIYRRAIYPLGQTYGVPAGGEVAQFRGLAVRYGARGVSWWDYAWTSRAGLWSAISGALSMLAVPPLGEPPLAQGDRGDHVLWLQEHLAAVVGGQATSGLFGPQTAANLRRFQARRGLSTTGRTDAATWRELLRVRPVRVSWTGAMMARARRSAPESASLRAIGYEIPELGAARGPAKVSEP